MTQIINDYLKDRKLLYVFLAGFILGALLGNIGIYVLVFAFLGYAIWTIIKNKKERR